MRSLFTLFLFSLLAFSLAHASLSDYRYYWQFNLSSNSSLTNYQQQIIANSSNFNFNDCNDFTQIAWSWVNTSGNGAERPTTGTILKISNQSLLVGYAIADNINGPNSSAIRLYCNYTGSGAAPNENNFTGTFPPPYITDDFSAANTSLWQDSGYGVSVSNGSTDEGPQTNLTAAFAMPLRLIIDMVPGPTISPDRPIIGFDEAGNYTAGVGSAQQPCAEISAGPYEEFNYFLWYTQNNTIGFDPTDPSFELALPGETFIGNSGHSTHFTPPPRAVYELGASPTDSYLSQSGNLVVSTQNQTCNSTSNQIVIGAGNDQSDNPTVYQVATAQYAWPPPAVYTTGQAFLANSAPTIISDLAFTNASAGHWFYANATVSDPSGGSDIRDVAVQTSAGSCLAYSNSTRGNNFTASFNCSATAPAAAAIHITFSSQSGANATTSTKTNAYPDPNLPTLTAPSISPSTAYANSTLTCQPGTFSDADADTENASARNFTWYRNGTAISGQTASTLALNSTAYRAGDNISCAQTATNSTWATSNVTSAKSSNLTINASGTPAPCSLAGAVNVTSCQTLSQANTLYCLQNSVSISNADCFDITAANVTLEGNNHAISGNNNPNVFAVNANPYGIRMSASVRDLRISGFSYGVYFSGVSNGTIVNNTINATGQSTGISLYAAGSIPAGNNTVANNTLYTNGTQANGIQIGSFTQNSTIVNNTISASGANSNGVWLTGDEGGTLNNAISFNTIIVNGSGKGVYLEPGSNSTVSSNTIYALSGGCGISLVNFGIPSQNNTVFNNSVNASGFGANGISVSGSGVSFNAIRGNAIRSTGPYGDCISINSGSSNAVSNNSLWANASSGAGLVALAPSSGNLVYWNDFLSGQYFIGNANATNAFNTTVAGVPEGNFYADIGSLNITDSNNDGYGDSGSQYPYSAASTTNFTGIGADWGPKMKP